MNDSPQQHDREPQYVPTGRLADLLARAERWRTDTDEHLSSLHADGQEPQASELDD